MGGAQDAQGVFDERVGRDRAEQFAFKVRAPVERIDDLVGARIGEDGVDGEVAAARGLRHVHVRVAFDDEAAMAAPGFALAARQRHVQIRAQLIDRERLADRIHAPQPFEQRAQTFRRNAVDFNVPILRRMPQQRIAHAAADQQRAPARSMHGLCKAHYFGGNVNEHHD